MRHKTGETTTQLWWRARYALLLALVSSMCLTGVALADTGPQLSVDAATGQHPISPYIYGLNFAEPGLAAELSLPIDRWGGNTTDTYNFKIGADNTGSDYYYENVSDCWNEAHHWCSGQSHNEDFAYREFVAKDESVGAKTLFTLPLVGYVANDAPVAQPLTCGFPASDFPHQESFDPYDTNCGNGVEGGQPVKSEQSRDGIPTSAAYDGEFVKDLVNRYGKAENGGVAIYELGNEPGLWDSTHRDVDPSPTTYEELWDKSHEAALEVKKEDPSAEILGFSEWGWPNYFCSAADGAPQQTCTASNPDRKTHGGVPLVEWFLQQFHHVEESTGQRLLNYIDVHYYAQGGSNTEVTRSLWDPTYTDPSWIEANIDLIPRMHEWVDKNYSGTKIALSEYNLSVSSSPVINALIQADTLGIFAREGLDLATRWPLASDGPDIPYAFLMYRDYDGHGSRFGDTFIQSQSTSQNELSVYGARRSSDGAYTIMVINKTATPLQSPLTLTNLTTAGAAQVWQWSGGEISQEPDIQPANGTITATYPPESITLYVIDSGSPSDGTQSPASPPQSQGTNSNTSGGSTPTPLSTTIAEPTIAIFKSAKGSSVRVRSGKLTVSSGFELQCPGVLSPCRVRLSATVKAPASRRRHARPKTVLIATASVNVPAGLTRELDFALDHVGEALLKKLKHLNAELAISASSTGAPITALVLFPWVR